MPRLEYAPSGRTFITSDTHFGQSNAIVSYDRPFSDIQEMESSFIDRCNQVMGRNAETIAE